MSKFLLNMNAVNEEAEKMNSSSSALYFSRKKIPNKGDIDIRIMPPVLSLNGLFYMKRIQYWINNKPYISPETFNLPCPIKQISEGIAKSDNEDLKALLTSKNFSKQEDYILPILLLKPEYQGNKRVRIDVVDNCVKFFDVTWGLIKALNSLVSHRQYQNGTDLGIFDPDKGFNIIVTKEESSNKTEYKCMGWIESTPVEEKYLDNIPDVVEHFKEKLKSNSFLEGVAKHFFFGEAMPVEESRTSQPTQKIESKPVEKKPEPTQEAKTEAPKVTTSDSNKPLSLMERLKQKQQQGN